MRSSKSAKIVVVAGTLVLVGGMTAMGPRGSCRGRGGCATLSPDSGRTRVAIPIQNESVVSGVLHMREEEKIARDVYRVLGELWGANVFLNITQSEQRHMDSMAMMIDRYRLTDPIVDDTVGVFAAPEFVELYGELIANGERSLMDAYKVGALIEELDIVDLREALEDVRDPVLASVYENLMRGSRNHLRAFARQINNNGGTYEARYLTQDEFDAIANSPHEPGG